MPDNFLFPSLFRWLVTRIFPEGGEGHVGFYVLYIVGLLSSIILPYLLGSVNTAILISRKRFGDDIRNHGSGNAGTTNVLRTYGKKYAVLTLLLDVLKGALGAFIGAALFGLSGMSIGGFFVIFGHMFPIYFKFKGGKGVATTLGVTLVACPIVSAMLVAVFAIIFIGTHYVSLASAMCALVYPLFVNSIYGNYGSNILMAILTTVFVFVMHRTNLQRLYEGRERKTYLKKEKQAEADAALEARIKELEKKNGKHKN